ncbi:RRXRR domain-containing protein [Spirillospora sp. NPDC052242]
MTWLATFRAGRQTHPSVLPQQAALESASADTPGNRDETRRGRRTAAPGTDHGRGETAAASPGGRDVTPAPHGGGEKGREVRTRQPAVFVLDKDGRPLQPTTPPRARKLLRSGRAAVARHTPFVIRIRDRTVRESRVDGVEIGIDPGSRHTGMAVFTSRQGERRARFGVGLDHRCIPCNLAKGDRPVEEFAPAEAAAIKARAMAPLRDAAALNATRQALWRVLDARLPVHTSSGGRTKWNRTRNDLPKSHTLDALAVGELDSITEVVPAFSSLAARTSSGSGPGTSSGPWSRPARTPERTPGASPSAPPESSPSAREAGCSPLGTSASGCSSERTAMPTPPERRQGSSLAREGGERP